MKKARLFSSVTRYTLVLFGLGIIWSCAAIAPPSGGPKDEIPPVLVAADPPSGTVWFRGGITRLTFSEYLSENSVAKAVQVFPRLAEPVTARYKGREILIEWPADLDSGQTYILSLSRELKDEHGVSLATNLQLAYSTGSTVAEGSVAGRVWGPATGVNLWRLSNAESVDSVFFRYPDYTTETDDEGFYSFHFLSPGRYQVCAIEKAGVGQPLQSFRWAFGLPAASPLEIVAGEARTNIDIRSRVPQEPLRVLQGNWQVSSWGKIDFSRVPDSTLTISVQSVASDTAYSLLTYPDPQEAKAMIVETPDERSDTDLNLNIVIRYENNVYDTTRLTIVRPDGPDSTVLSLLQPKKGTTLTPEAIRVVPLDIIFSQPTVNLRPEEWGTVELDTSYISGELIFRSPVHWQFLPRTPWSENKTYSLVLDSLAWQAKNGLGFSKDNIRQSFQVGKQVGFGDLSGRLQVTGSTRPAVQVTAVENPDHGAVSGVNSSFEFRFTSLEEGMYTLMVFDDLDDNLSYSYGTIIPFQAAEWFRVLPDTVEIRANWEKELHPIMIEE